MKSESVMLVLVTALISGLLGSVLTILWQKHYESRRLKLHIFETLMAYRYLIWSQESVNAINSVSVVFYKHKAVRTALKEFLDEASKLPDSNRSIEDKHLRLLEEIAKALGLKTINWEEIKHYYSPGGLMDTINEDSELRKLQIKESQLIIDRELLQKDNSIRNTDTGKETR